MTLRIAVIGAGPSGLAQLRSFQSAEKKGFKIPEIVCFEKQSDWGGLWNYTWRVGLDEYGEAIHGSMYRYLWSNAPKECLEFADYSFEEHFGKPIPSYPPREVLWDYIKGRVEKAGVKHWIRFNTPARMITYNQTTEKFSVTVHDRLNDRMYTEIFDYVVVASGHFSTPDMPYFKGFESFNGRVLHAHDFRDALEFKDQDVLIIGRSYSAEDIGSQCYKYGARSITTSYRSKPMGFNFPNNWQEVPLLERVENKMAYFIDGSSKKIDAIILCTGYKHHFPFLPDDLRLQTKNRLWPLNLYKGIFWEQNPKLIYLGMQDQIYTFNMFDAQAWYARDVIMKRIALPTLESMKKDSNAWRAREEKLTEQEQMVEFQGNYIEDLIAATDYPCFDIQKANKIQMEWEQHKQEDFIGFRNNTYRSVRSGLLSPRHHTAWIDALDDSLEDFMKCPAKEPIVQVGKFIEINTFNI